MCAVVSGKQSKHEILIINEYFSVAFAYYLGVDPGDLRAGNSLNVKQIEGTNLLVE